MTTAAVALIVALAAPAATVTQAEYDAAQIGWSRHHVQQVYGTRGHKVVVWYGEAGHKYVKRAYPTDDGGTTTAVYRDTLPTATGDEVGVMKLTRKEWDQ